MGSRPAAGGGRWVLVEPSRLARWLDGFVARHGAYAVDGLRIRAFDGTIAQFEAPPGIREPADLEALAVATATPPPIGLLLARRAGVAVGVVEGSRVVSSKVDSRYVQGRTAAGGWSQQRFARRRENQARAAAADAANLVAKVLLPDLDRLASVVAGGDRRAVDAIMTDRRLVPVHALLAGRFLEVSDPKLAALEHAVSAARAIRVRIMDPA